ncbi:MAG: lysylphosphatidylglycerol synthase transmembrane domain-containing protein [Syntrophomonadaceae bacterium]
MDRGRLLARFKFLRYLFPLLCLGIFAAIFLPRLSLPEVAAVLRQADRGLVLLAVLAQVGSYLGSGYMLSAMMRYGKIPLSIGRGALITMAAASLGMVAGGWVSAAVATSYWISRDAKTPGGADIAAVLPAVYNTVMLILVSFLGTVYLLLNHTLTTGQAAFYGTVMAITIVVIVIIILGLLNWERVKRLLLGLLSPAAVFFQKDALLTKASARIDRFYEALQPLRHGGWTKPGLGAFVNVVLDLLTLYFFFLAAGYAVKPSVLLAGYSIAFLLGKTAFFVPGGAGVIEAGMVAIYGNLGVPGSIGFIAVLGYRLLSFWIPSLLGFIVMFYFQKPPGAVTRA